MILTIDIIIPAYNAHDTLDRALASIAMQTIRPYLNVIISDDASDTSYDELVDKWNGILNIFLLRSESNGGPGIARQRAFDSGSSDFVTFLDADDSFVSALALDTLLNEMIKGSHDLVYGSFAEELNDGSVVQHEENMTWLFGKLYRRAFLEHFDIRFNDTRANEDMGFNAVVKGCTHNIKFIRRTVYLWHFRDDSITRINNASYALFNGFQGYIKNLVWEVNELMRRGIGVKDLKQEAVEALCGIYFTILENMIEAPGDKDRLLHEAALFYNEIYLIFEPYVDKAFLNQVCLEVQKKRLALYHYIIPEFSFDEFLHKIQMVDYSQNAVL